MVTQSFRQAEGWLRASHRDCARLTELRDRRWSEPEARMVLDAVEHAGESIGTFARRHGLDAQRIYKWRRQFARAINDREHVDEITFAPVVVTGLGRTSAALVVRSSEVEIEILDPTRVDPAWLAQVIAATRVG